MNIVYKDIANPKLTIAKDRVELKLPSVAKVVDEFGVIAFANRIVAEIGVVEYTLRGVFEVGQKISIAMCQGTPPRHKLFKLFTE